MTAVRYSGIEGFAGNPAFSEVAVIPAGSDLVWIGGQNSVLEDRTLAGKGDPVEQARVIGRRLDQALAGAGCGWDDVVRVHVYFVAGADPRALYSVFQPRLAARKSPPLVVGLQVAGLAHPDFLLEVSVEAVRPGGQRMAEV